MYNIYILPFNVINSEKKPIKANTINKYFLDSYKINPFVILKNTSPVVKYAQAINTAKVLFFAEKTYKKLPVITRILTNFELKGIV